MREYVTPRMTGETFASNEYISVCWGVACDWEWANVYEQDHNNWYGGNISHAEDHCGNSSNQVIFDDDEDGIADRMVEVGTDGLGNLSCTIYRNQSYKNPVNISSITSKDIGQTIYWTTSASGRTWHHRGVITATAEGHPNRS